jgi:hypothetical protein
VFRRHAAISNDAAEIQSPRHVAIDGKTSRRSFDNFLDRRAAHMLSAFATDTALVLAHLDCDEKSNEIPAVQTLLGSLALSDAVVPVDAMHCQKETFEHAAAGCAHLIAQVKANQPVLHHAVAELCNTATDTHRHDPRCSGASEYIVDIVSERYSKFGQEIGILFADADDDSGLGTQGRDIVRPYPRQLTQSVVQVRHYGFQFPHQSAPALKVIKRQRGDASIKVGLLGLKDTIGIG